MTEEEEIEVGEEEARRKKKKKGEGEGAARGREALQISEAANDLMRERGLSLGQISEILRSWRHLNAREVAVRLAEFGKDVAKASAHIIVSFADSGYAVMTHFLKQCEKLAEMARKLTPDNRQKIQKKHDVNLG